MSEDGFLSRWSRRKQDVREGREVEPEPEQVVQAKAPTPEAAPAPTPPPAPTLDDTHALTPEADFTRFVQPHVAPEVKNAALKKLFADPHFNAMDGLDVYIDDYGKPDPLPAAMARQLASAQFLKLFDDEETKPKEGREVANDPAARTVAQSATDAQAVPAPDPHADPDLRLQQDDAPGPGQAGPGAG